MVCDVCGHEMRQVPKADPRVKERWACSWCYAWTELGAHPGLVSRSWYEPAHLRWERAEAAELPTGVSHAYGWFGATLCGMQREDVVPTPYPWVPEWDDACPGCRAAAVVIDSRWPVDVRGEKRERARPAPPPGADWPPF